MNWKDWPIAKLTFCLSRHLSTIGGAWEYLQNAQGFPGLGRDRLATAFERFWLVNPDLKGEVSFMAKKRAGSADTDLKQKSLGDIVDQLPEEVETAMGEFLDAKRASAKASSKQAEKKQRLIEEAQKAGLKRLRIDGENKFVEIGAKDTVTVKTVPKTEESRRKRRQAKGVG